MGQITSGVGLISGIDTASLIDQLMAIEARPKTLVQQRSAVLTAQQVAFQEISAKLLTLKLSTDSLATRTTFNTNTATSSNEDVLGVSAGSSAVPGTYDFVVSRLITTQQLVTGGFADRDATAIAPSGGTLTFEAGDGKLTNDVRLSRLNGGEGVNRGKIRITDRSGASEIIDLSTALTLDDVITKINNASNVSVQASLDGDRLQLTDLTGSTAASLTVANIGSTATATGLGLVGTAAGSTLTGSVINTIGEDTLLDDLNDGNGVRFASGVADVRVTLRDGSTVDVNLSDSSTLGEVIDKFNDALGANATVAINDAGNGIKITDHTAGVTTSAVTALNSSNAARDLGLLVGDYDSDGVIQGQRVIANLGSKLLKSLNGGSGVSQSFALADPILTGSTLLSSLFNGAGTGTNGSPLAADLRLKPRNTATITNVEVDDLTTVQDFLDRINTTFAGKITATIEDNSIRLTDITGGTGNFGVFNNGSTSTFASTLGIAINTTVSTVLSYDLEPTRLPTQDYGPGQISVTNSAGVATEIDLTAAQSVDDVIKLINDAGAGVTVALNRTGNGLTVTDTAGGAGDLIIADVGGSIASELNLAGTHSTGVASSGNLQVQYLSEATRIEAMHGGKGITRGKFTITDSNGAKAIVDLTQGNEITLADVISEINSRGIAVTARINDTGDGLLLEDTGSGAVALTVAESGSTTAKDLGILGAADSPGADLDGSFERTITVDAADTLDDLVDKINDAGVNVKATIINDGTASKPYRLSLLAAKEGKSGAFVFDDGGLNFNAVQLVEAKNAVLFYGSTDPAQGIAIESASTQLENVVSGATISLKNASTSPVRVTISRNNQAVADEISDFVTKFNAVVSALDKYDKYDAETEERGLLLGDSTVSRVRNSLFSLLSRRNTDVSGQYNALSQVGLTVGSGASVQFDQAKLLTALENDRDAVIQLFTLKTTETDDETNETTILTSGFGVDFQELIKGLTDSQFGAVQTRIDSIDNQLQLNTKRIEDIDTQLASKRARLEAQFLAMEQALAQMQKQSSALTQLAAIGSSTG